MTNLAGCVRFRLVFSFLKFLSVMLLNCELEKWNAAEVKIMDVLSVG